MPRQSRRAGMILTPLWIISLFISLTEAVAGIAAVRATGSTQLLFSVFSVTFPILVAFAFFWTLWRRPWVFYTPGEYSQSMDVRRFVRALRHPSPKPIVQNGTALISSGSGEMLGKHSSVGSAALLSLLCKQLEQSRIADVIAFFDELKQNEFYLDSIELRSIYSTLARLCGKPDAYRCLQEFSASHLGFYEISQYELALLRYGKGIDTSDITPSFNVEALSLGPRRLWASFLTLCSVANGDLTSAAERFRLVKSDEVQKEPAARYSAIQTAICAAALGMEDLAVVHLDIARHKHREAVNTAAPYPPASLTIKYDRAFVHSLIGVEREVSIDFKEAFPLRGHLHVLARHARVLRLCDSALETLTQASRSWKIPLHPDAMKRRLKDFEDRCLSKAGTIFTGA